MLFIGNLNVIKNNKTSILKQIVKFVQLSWPGKKTNRKKEKGYTWRRYTTQTTLLVSEIKMTTQRLELRSRVSYVFSARLSLVVKSP